MRARRGQTLSHAERAGGAGGDARPRMRRSTGVVDRRREQRRMFEFDRIVHEPGAHGATLGWRKSHAIHISVVITGASALARNCSPAPFIRSARATRLRRRELRPCPTNCWKANCRCKKALTLRYQDRIGLFEWRMRSIFLDEVVRPRQPSRSSFCGVAEREISACARVEEGRCARHRRDNRDLESKWGGVSAAISITGSTPFDHLPALAERPGDIRNRRADTTEVNRAFAGKFLALRPSPWTDCAPVLAGNVRELHNEIQRMVPCRR